MEEVERVLEALAARTPDPLAAPAARGRWRHLWGGDHEAAVAEAEPESHAPRSSLEQRVAALEHEIEDLKRQMESFRRQFE
jgi:uncharacterized protein YceH (UPF0502 family)